MNRLNIKHCTVLSTDNVIQQPTNKVEQSAGKYNF